MLKKVSKSHTKKRLPRVETEERISKLRIYTRVQNMCESTKKHYTDRNIQFGQLIVLTATFIILIFYTFYTYDIAKKTTESNRLTSRPVLVLLNEQDTPYRFKNVGNGPALNIIIVRGYSGDLFLNAEEHVLTAVPSNNGTGGIPENSLEKISKNELIRNVPKIKELVEELLKKENNFICLIYEDIYGKSFASIVNGAIDNPQYSSALEYKEL